MKGIYIDKKYKKAVLLLVMESYEIMQFRDGGYRLCDLGYCISENEARVLKKMPGVLKQEKEKMIAFCINENELDKRIEENYKGKGKLLLKMISQD